MKYVFVVTALTAVLFGVGYTICETESGQCEPVNSFNLVVNPSFEELTIDNRIPDGWLASGLSGSEGQDCTTASTDTCSFQMSAHGANKVKTVSQMIDRQGFANDFGTFRVFVKSEGKAKGFPTYSAIFHHADGTSETVTFPAEGGFHDWQQYESVFTVSQDYVSIEVVLTFGGAEHVWFDDVFLRLGPGIPPEVTITP